MPQIIHKKTCEFKILTNGDITIEYSISNTMEAFANACNFAVKHAFDNDLTEAKNIQEGTYTTLRLSFGMKAQMACQVCRHVAGSVKTLRTNNHYWQLKEKNKYPLYKPVLYKVVRERSYSFVNPKKDEPELLPGQLLLSVSLIDGRHRIPVEIKGKEEFLDNSWMLGDGWIVKRKNNFYFQISAKKMVDVPEPESVSAIVGVDLGMNKIVAANSSEETMFVDGKKIKNIRAKYKHLRKELQQRQTPAARRKLRKIGSQENRYINDINHCVSKALVNHFPSNSVFILEDLEGIRGSLEQVRVKDRYYSVSWAYADLRSKILYKAHERNQEVLLVAPDYTSQRCPICGNIDRNSRNKFEHRYKCVKCGYQSNDDRIGAMNLRFKGEMVLAYLKSVEDPNVYAPDEIPGQFANEFLLARGLVSDPEQEAKLKRFLAIQRQQQTNVSSSKRKKKQKDVAQTETKEALLKKAKEGDHALQDSQNRELQKPALVVSTSGQLQAPSLTAGY